jgi:hypothetical protein
MSHFGPCTWSAGQCSLRQITNHQGHSLFARAAPLLCWLRGRPDANHCLDRLSRIDERHVLLRHVGGHPHGVKVCDRHHRGGGIVDIRARRNLKRDHAAFLAHFYPGLNTDARTGESAKSGVAPLGGAHHRPSSLQLSQGVAPPNHHDPNDSRSEPERNLKFRVERIPDYTISPFFESLDCGGSGDNEVSWGTGYSIACSRRRLLYRGPLWRALE